jgi:uncharacterized protein YgiB involved in biofilm formation
MDTLPPRRMRSAAAGLSAIGAAAMLSGCEPSPEELSRQQFGAPTAVAAFQSVAECVAAGDYTRQQCDEAQRTAGNADKRAAPRFADQTLCEDQFGSGSCQARTNGGQSFFSPLLTGFLIGQLANGGGYRYGGLYRDRRDNRYYTGSGAWLYNGGYGGRGYRYQVGSSAIANPVTTSRIQTRSSVVSRGGFGGRASSRGGWGG